MIFYVTMKNPDVLQDAIEEAVREEVSKSEGLSESEREAVEEVRRGKVQELCDKWFEYGEYLRVEINTEAGTCTVVE